jgi:spermidine synthase
MLAPLTAFAAGFLLFAVEPMIARALLPSLGGGALVWATSVAFFQLVLLVAAALAQATARLGRSRQALLAAVPVAAAVATLPLGAPAPIPGGGALGLMAALARALFGCCLSLGITGALLQQWRARKSDPTASRIYAASNAGSLIGLFAYPLLIEPLAGLGAQRFLWSAGYALFAALAVGAFVKEARRVPAAPAAEPGVAPTDPPRSPGARLEWFLLAFVPCSLLLGVTAHMTNEVPGFPLLWTVPLGLYLVSLVIAFGSTPERWMRGALALQPVTTAMLAVMMFVPVRLGAFSVHLLACFVASLVVHGRLAEKAPSSPDARAEYVLWMAAGGAAAGLFSALVAPAIFPAVVEFPLALVASCLLRPPPAAPRRGFDPAAARRRDLLFPALLAAFTLLVLRALPHAGDARDVLARVAVLTFSGAMAVVFRRRPLRFGLGVAAVLAGGLWSFQLEGTERLARSPYGTVRVVRQPGPRWVLFHGTTIHGAEGPKKEPELYYAPSSAAGQVLSTTVARTFVRRAAMIGMGTGSLAWYATAGQRIRFFEIDPLVVEIARDPRWFTFLADSRAAIEVVEGDGRVSIAAEPDASYELIVLDAFSSDTIPVHLLTTEALAIYLQKLAPEGIILVNTSNRHADVAGVVLAGARAVGAFAEVSAAASERALGEWVLIARSEVDARRFISDPSRWRTKTEGPEQEAWTDDHSSILGALRNSAI